MSSHIRKVFAWLSIVLFLLGIVGGAFGQNYYSASYTWGFQNYSYLSFNQPVNFTDTPHQGLPYDSNLVGYWNMNEGSGSVANDSSGNGNNGVIYGASWVDGKFGTGLSFNGTNHDYISLPIAPSTAFGANDFSISSWFRVNNATLYSALISNYISGTSIFVRWLGSPLTLQFVCASPGNQVTVDSGLNLIDNQWHQVTVTRSGSVFSIYIDGVLKKSVTNTLVGNCCSSTNQWLFMKTATYVYYTSGILDEVYFYNRSLSAVEATALYTQPDPVSFVNYYDYLDPQTNNTMMIHVDNANANSSDSALVTCTNFFADNKLVFQANDSATVNVWTNLGQPTFQTNGVWNSNNYTTTLTLDASSTVELNWNMCNITTYVDAHSSVSPSNVTVPYGVGQIFSFNASPGYRFNVAVDGVSQGQISSYSFSNITESHTINVTSTQLFTITASAGGNGDITPSGSVILGSGENQQFNFTGNTGCHISKVLVDNASTSLADSYTFSNVQQNHTISVSFAINTYNITATTDAYSTIAPGNVTVNYGGNQQFNITTELGYTSNVYVDGVQNGNLTSYNFNNVQDNHTITVTSEPLQPANTATATTTPNPSSSTNSSTTPSSSPGASQSPPQNTQTISFPTETALIAIIVVLVMVIVVLSFQKGYVTIETSDEEKLEEAREEEKSKESPYDEALDY